MLLPFNFGNAGIKGDTKQLSNGMGLDLEAQVLSKSKTEPLEWGALLGMRQANLGLPSGGLSSNNMRFGLLARIKL